MVVGAVATFFEVPATVWAEFRARAGLDDGAATDTASDTDEELRAFEGDAKRRFVLHRKRESRLRNRKIEATIAASVDSRIRCEVPGCEFDFEEVYGEIGRSFAEVHHLRPLSEREVSKETTLSDLAVVCSNCHRMIHRNGQNRPLDELIR
jgi:predicted HNH restriction endonuclease